MRDAIEYSVIALLGGSTVLIVLMLIGERFKAIREEEELANEKARQEGDQKN